MPAVFTTYSASPRPFDVQADPEFLPMLPAIRRAASFAFRHVRRVLREDLIAEVIANAFAAFRRLVARGKAALAYPTVLAKFAVRQVCEGRRLGSRTSGRDILSPSAQRRFGFSVQPFSQFSSERQWQELVVEDRHVSPAEVAALRIDFATWLKRLKRSQRQMALRLVAGDTTTELASRLGLSMGRISQLRKALRRSWEEFQVALTAPC